MSASDQKQLEAEREMLASNTKQMLDSIGVDFEAFRSGDPAAIEMLTMAVKQSQEDEADALGPDVGSPGEVVAAMRDSLEAAQDTSSLPQEAAAVQETQKQLTGVLGKLNGPI